MKLFSMNLMFIFNLMFLSLNHPMSMGLVILIQLLMSIIIMNLFMQMFWFSYIIFLMFIGGMLILFIYMCSISSNNILLVSPKLMIFLFSSNLINLIIMMIFKNNYLINYNLMMNINTFLNLNLLDLNMNMMFLSKMFNNYSSFITLFLIIYLFILMILVNKITNFNMGPLRKN